ncbi:MAG: antibiotic biosynthesis monooxygenase [Rhizomicrobium sp.]
MVFELLFQTIDPARRHEYPAAYSKALARAAFEGCHGGRLLLDENDPSGVVVLLEWDSAQHHERVMGTPAHTEFLKTIRAFAIAPRGHFSNYVAHKV